jgi:O-6-methylguanine DNA methyltransferase
MFSRNHVYQITARIPIGYVATYGQIARLAGNPKAARAVGMYMKINPFAPRVPCHRVVASDGTLTGFSAPGGIAKKKKMLLDEGVRFIGEKVDISSFWKTS